MLLKNLSRDGPLVVEGCLLHDLLAARFLGAGRERFRHLTPGKQGQRVARTDLCAVCRWMQGTFVIPNGSALVCRVSAFLRRDILSFFGRVSESTAVNLAGVEVFF